MKFKQSFSIFTAAIGLLACSISAHAQKSGLNTLFNGGTTAILPATTNQVVVSGVTNYYGAPGTSTNLILSVSEYDYVGFTLSFTGTATSTNDFLIYKSFDGGTTFEANPSFSYTGLAPGAASFATNAALDVHGVTTLAFVNRSRGTTYATNVLESINLKSPKFGARQATQ